jgi:hypothetical protein
MRPSSVEDPFMAIARYARENLVKREADIAQARNLVRGRVEEYDGVGAAFATVAEGAPDAWISWSRMGDDVGMVAAALQRGRADLAAPGRGGSARLASAVALLGRLEKFLGGATP